MRRGLGIVCLLALMLLPIPVRAQELASLVADQITVDPAGRVTATGNVQVFYQGTVMTARAVSYDQNGDQLTITGPIEVNDGSGTALFANQAELDRDLRDGVLTSARMVLDQQLQIAAAEIARVDDRYTRLDRVVASSCEVCAANPVPLWEIRAARVIHDDVERQLYFSNAQIRISGVPIMFLPRLRLPDPTLKRASGFLIPQFKTSSDLGTGLKVPYFFAFGDHRDLALKVVAMTEVLADLREKGRVAFEIDVSVPTLSVVRDLRASLRPAQTAAAVEGSAPAGAASPGA